jgi:hypothetical protein
MKIQTTRVVRFAGNFLLDHSLVDFEIFDYNIVEDDVTLFNSGGVRRGTNRFLDTLVKIGYRGT